MTHEEMLEEAAKREAIVAQVSEEDYQKVLDAAKEKQVLEIAKNFIEEHSEAMEKLAEIERKEFYRFFAVEYFGTGEGMSFWLKICRNYPPHNGRDYDMERFKEFIGCDHYYPGIEEPTEEEFRTQYANLIPDYITKMLDKRDQPGFDWETHYHFIYRDWETDRKSVV